MFSLSVRALSLASQLPQCLRPFKTFVPDREPVGAGLPAMNDDAVPDQNSSVLDNEICRESPIDTKNRLAAEV
jgi:hypothetical protein